MTDIETLLEATGEKLVYHYSDIYVKVTPETRQVLDSYEFKQNVTTFKSNITGETMYEFPLASNRYYERKTK